MKDLAVYGAGGLGREITCMIRGTNIKTPRWNIIGFFDDGKNKGEEIIGFGPVLGGMNELNLWPYPLDVVLCFGSPTTLQTVANRISNPNISFPNIVAQDFAIADLESFKIGHGNIITEHCGVTTNITIGNFNLLNGSIVLAHDVQIGNFNVFMPGTRISGGVTIRNRCLFGSGSFVKQELTIPDGVTLSPLSPLLVKPKADSLYIGNPAKRIKL